MEKQTFRELVEGVLENNEINDGTWESWEDAQSIQSIYGELVDENKSVYETFLNALIRDNGENLELYIQCCDALEYGFVYHRHN